VAEAERLANQSIEVTRPRDKLQDVA